MYVLDDLAVSTGPSSCNPSRSLNVTSRHHCFKTYHTSSGVGGKLKVRRPATED